MLRHAAQDEEVGQDVDDVGGFELPVDPDRQAFPRELVDDIQHAVLPSVMGAILDEVVGPDMVGPLGPQTDAGPVAQPEPAAFRLPGWDLQPLLPPDPLDPLVVDHPARRAAQQGGDLAVAEAAMLPGERDEVGRQLLLVVPAPRDLALCRAMLAERRQARRSEIDRACRTCSMQARRRAGLSSFPVPPPSG